LERSGGIAFDFLDRYRKDGPVHTDFMVTRYRGPACYAKFGILMIFFWMAYCTS
jgi:hypothetical protein